MDEVMHGRMQRSAAEALRHVWDRISPSECAECRAQPQLFLSHVFALAAQLLNSFGDQSGDDGSPAHGYTLAGALHAAVQQMHMQPLPDFSGIGRTLPEDTPLGTVAVRHIGAALLTLDESSRDHDDAWGWWSSEHRSASDALYVLTRAFESVPPSEPRARSGRVFLLGAGFSKAVDQGMPAMRDLLDRLKSAAEADQWLTADLYGLREADDLEAWLDSLAAPQPYRTDAENSEASGLFRRSAAWIGTHLADAQQNAFETGFPACLVELLSIFQAGRSTVITLNYDTIIECCVNQHHGNLGMRDVGALPASKIRAAPMTPSTAYRGVARLDGDGTSDVFRLAKLHGSIDWLYAGGNGRGLPIYTLDEDESRADLPQLVPYLIPPCFTKVEQFDHEVVRENWSVARRGLERAEELIVMGYSLPPADTAVVQMLRTFAPDNVVVLDTNPTIADRYRALLQREVTESTEVKPIWSWVQNVSALAADA